MKKLFIFLCVVTTCHAADFPAAEWTRVTAAEAGLNEARLAEARGYALTGGGSGCIIHRGRLAMEWGDFKKRYDLKSTAKSFGAAALGIAIADGRIRLDDKVARHHPAFGVPPDSNLLTGWLNEITIRQLASQTAGFDKKGGYGPLLFKPGAERSYSDAGPNWLAECVTLAYKRDVADLMFERLFTPLGIQHTDLIWRKNAYRPDLLDGIKRREFGSGISANVDAMARFGLLWLRQGEWNGKQILPRDFVKEAGTTQAGVPGLNVRNPEHYGHASNHYGLLWWNNADETIEGLPSACRSGIVTLASVARSLPMLAHATAPASPTTRGSSVTCGARLAAAWTRATGMALPSMTHRSRGAVDACIPCRWVGRRPWRDDASAHEVDE